MSSARDISVIVIMMFAVSLMLFVIHYATKTMISEIVAIPAINASQGAVTSFQGTSAMTNRFDYAIFLIFIGFVLSVIITGWFVGGEPIFMFIYFLAIVFAVVISIGLANVWVNVTEGGSYFGTTITSFPIANHLMMYLPIYTVVMGFLGIIVMFSKPYISGQ